MDKRVISTTPVAPICEQPWAAPCQQVVEELKVDPLQGLSRQEVVRRRRFYGDNRLHAARAKSVWVIFIDQFKSLIVVLLGAAAVVSLLFGDWVEAMAILGVLAINGLLGFVAELRAVRSMEALRRLGNVQTRVRRDGRDQVVDAEKLVCGDIVIVEGGDVVSADLRLFEASKIQADESLLTGESVPSGKACDPIEADASLADRHNMLFKGTSVTRGSGQAVVVATGMGTELGHIAGMVAEADDESTALEDRLARLGHRLIWLTLGIAAATTLLGAAKGQDLRLMIETGIALAVAAIPEGLPIVATIALARGMWRMARRNALVNRLAAVETLGSTTLIYTDKTGTLTENRMTVRRVALATGDVEVSGEGMQASGEFTLNGIQLNATDDPALRAACEVCALCNNASLPADGGSDATGDPLEVALLVLAAKAGITQGDLLSSLPEQKEEAFDPATKMMATVHGDGDRYRVAVKGAAESVLAACTHILDAGNDVRLDEGGKQRWQDANESMASDGMRVLAVAQKRVDSLDSLPYEGLTLIGLIGMLDPPRNDVSRAIQACHDAGVRVVMVTGDQPATALNIARAVGVVQDDDVRIVRGGDLRPMDALTDEERRQLCDVPIFARVDPKQKLELIALQQGAGQIVAMTGDGVNDAPALRRADIGIAMGKRGTQVAREAADMVLTDDAFSSIVAAIRQGRVIFNNIRKFVLYLLSCNLSEVLVVAGATALNLPLPILPLQILFLNLVTDVFPALALAMGEGDAHIMSQPPRHPKEPVLRRIEWFGIVGGGTMITLCVLAGLLLSTHWLGLPVRQATTVSFLTLAFAQIWHVFNMRSRNTSWWRNDITRNAWVWGAVALCVLLTLGAVYMPGLSDLLGTSEPHFSGWMLVVVFGVLPLVVGQCVVARLAPRSPIKASQIPA